MFPNIIFLNNTYTLVSGRLSLYMFIGCSLYSSKWKRSSSWTDDVSDGTAARASYSVSDAVPMRWMNTWNY